MPNSPRLSLSYPAKNDPSWYEIYTSFISQLDSSIYANREDRNIILVGGGTWTFDSATGSTGWSAQLEVYSPHRALLLVIPSGSFTIPDGSVAYVDVVRAPIAGSTLVFTVGNNVPSTNTALMICYRRGDYLYFRNGSRIESGTPSEIYGAGGGGGGASDLETVLGNGNTSGAYNIEMAAGQGLLFNEGAAVATGANQGAVYVKSDNGLYYRAESNGAETRLDVATDLASVLAVGNTTGGTDIELSVAGDSLVSSASVTLNIEAGADAPLTLSAGASTTGNGGSVSIAAGNTNALNFDGGSITLAAGTQTANNGVGGSITVTAGAGEAGGSVTLQAGAGNGDVGGDVRAIGSLQTGGTTPGRLDIFPDSGSGAQLRLTGAPVRTQGIHLFTQELLINRTGLPSTAANQGAVWVDDGSGALVNNGLYYRRESDGTTVRLDEASSASLYERLLAPKSEVDGNTATLIVGGPFPFDASEYAAFSTFLFQAVLSTNDTARTGTVQLYNLTDGEAVTNATLTVTGAGSTTPAKVTGTLTVGAAAGNLKNTEKIYEVRLSNDGTGDASKVTFLGEAILRLEP